MNEHLQRKSQNTILHLPSLSEYAGAVCQVMHELKNIGASPEQIISLLKSGSALPDIETRVTELEEMADNLQDTADNKETCLKTIADIYLAKTNAVKREPDCCNSLYETYTATQIAIKLGIFSIYGRPHAHAVSAIINDNLCLGYDGYKEDFVLFETKSIKVYYTRYGRLALAEVEDWLEDNDYPAEIESPYYKYHVRYLKD